MAKLKSTHRGCIKHIIELDQTEVHHIERALNAYGFHSTVTQLGEETQTLIHYLHQFFDRIHKYNEPYELSASCEVYDIDQHLWRLTTSTCSVWIKFRRAQEKSFLLFKSLSGFLTTHHFHRPLETRLLTCKSQTETYISKSPAIVSVKKEDKPVIVNYMQLDAKVFDTIKVTGQKEEAPVGMFINNAWQPISDVSIYEEVYLVEWSDRRIEFVTGHYFFQHYKDLV